MSQINYECLALAQACYDRHKFSRIEVPWWATRDIVNLTKPPHLPDDNIYHIEKNDKYLLASGEQGFMYLMNKGQLAPGAYQTITPCFRNDQYDELHCKQFMKLELISVLHKDSNIDDINLHLTGIISSAKYTMQELAKVLTGKDQNILQIGTHTDDPTAITGTLTYDLAIVHDNQIVELGSYGARQAIFGKWIYGTGIAEPRFSKVLLSPLLNSINSSNE